MQHYEITLAAEADLREIAQYTIQQWGEEQAMQYASALTRTFQSIANSEVTSRTFSERLPQMRVTRCEHHYVFYFHNKEKIPCILAVLHKRMDMLTRLVNRLST